MERAGSCRRTDSLKQYLPMSASTLQVENEPPREFVGSSSKPLRGFSANTAAVLSAQVGRVLMAILLEVVYARLLGPSGRGQMGLCMMVNGVGVLVGGLGGEVPIMLWAADKTKNDGKWFGSVVFCGLVGSVIASLSWGGSYWVWHPAFLRGITPAIASLLLISIPSSIFASYSLALFLGLNLLKQRSILVVANQVILLLLATALLRFYRPQAELAMIAVLLASLGTILITIWQLKRDFPFPRNLRTGVSHIVPALQLGIRSQLGNVATFFNYRLDVFIVNYYLNTSEVGLYALGVMISEALWQLPNAAATALLPRTARGSDASGTQFTCLVCRQVFTIACVSAVLVALLSPLAVPLVFGREFSASVAVIWWILPGTIVFAPAKVMSAELLGRGWPQYSSIIAVLTLCVTVSLDFYLIPRKGIQGAAIASSLAYFFNSLLITLVLKRKLSVTWKDLYVPSFSELALYRQIWNRFLTRVTPSPGLS